jgi:RNA methyltransferase, TrmH family
VEPSPYAAQMSGPPQPTNGPRQPTSGTRQPTNGPTRNALIDRFRRARRDRGLAVLEGFHALKHALRFGAPLLEVLTTDPHELELLAAELAPDLSGRLPELTTTVEPELLAALADRAPRTGVIALARRTSPDLHALIEGPLAAPLVLLEEPRDLNNVGACIRVAAAAQAAGVIVTGRHDPWHPDAIRGSAGLHFALPVLALEGLDQLQPRPLQTRPLQPRLELIAIDPDGEPLRPSALPARSILAFGSERRGISQALLERADAQVGIPMRPGVSSLNLATSVAAVLFSWRLCSKVDPGDWRLGSAGDPAPGSGS